ncbi:MAG TPA: polyprenyl diphosphate synthase [Acidimicrobiales bacterium]|nr:polyprenyl diphosphate synthase [Acidimicrobiales bacterium]
MAWSAPLYRVYERRIAGHLGRDVLPRHIGVILDGHRRYARAEGLLEYRESYEIGMAKLSEFLGWCAQLQAPAVTAWVLSIDNLTRPADELEPYFAVLIDLLQHLPELGRRLGFSLQIIGSLDLLPRHLAAAAKEAEQRCAPGGWHFNLALGYGGRQEIVDACRSLVTELSATGLSGEALAEGIDAAALSAHLYTADLPDPDLVIRTSGEARLSGFLLWQSAYAECVFVDPYWPAFRKVDFLRALRDYARRERRFGQ